MTQRARSTDDGRSLPENVIMLRPTVFLACLGFASVAGAEGIHKCVTSDGIAYQGSPCAGMEAPLSVDAARAVAVSPATASALSAVPDCDRLREAPAGLPWRHSAMCIGMTDDEVLNLAGWGRPARIARQRARHAWEEEWTFEPGATGNAATLHFVNGKLAAVEISPPQTLLASAALIQP